MTVGAITHKKRIYILFTSGLFLILETLFLLHISTWFLDLKQDISLFVTAILLFCLFPAFLIDKKFKATSRFYLTSIFICSFFPLQLIKPIQKYQNKTTADNLSRIIEKLTLYKEKEGVYPSVLTKLAPTYLNKIPEPFIGIYPQTFSFKSSGNNYTIEYFAFNGFTYGYSSETGKQFGYD